MQVFSLSTAVSTDYVPRRRQRRTSGSVYGKDTVPPLRKARSLMDMPPDRAQPKAAPSRRRLCGCGARTRSLWWKRARKEERRGECSSRQFEDRGMSALTYQCSAEGCGFIEVTNRSRRTGPTKRKSESSGSEIIHITEHLKIPAQTADRKTRPCSR